MPTHRAYYATATEAREAASAAVDALTAKWNAAALAAGAETESTTPVVGVRMDATTAYPPLAGIGAGLVAARITAPDGRTETATLAMATAETNALITAAYGTATATISTLSKVTARGRLAKSVQVTITGAGAVTFAAHVLQDTLTGKKYTSANLTTGPGVVSLDVTEADATDLGDVSFGSAMMFVAPPANVDPLAHVNRMAAFTVLGTASLTDSTGRVYNVWSNTAASDSAYGLSGDHTLLVSVTRSTTDGLAIDSSATLGDVLTFVAQPTATAATATVSVSRSATVPAGSALTYAGHHYTSVAEVVIYDTLSASISFVADVVGAASNIPVGSTLAFVTPPSGVDTNTGVATTVAAAVLPQRYASQLIGSPVTWSSRVARASDGRWMASVFSLPEGS